MYLTVYFLNSGPLVIIVIFFQQIIQQRIFDYFYELIWQYVIRILTHELYNNKKGPQKYLTFLITHSS